MMYHHVLSLLLWPYAFYVEKCIVAIGYFLFTESSNFLLNLRWHMAEKQYEGPAMMLVQFLFLIMYTAVRVLPIPWFVWLFVKTDFSQFSYFEMLLTLTCVIPLMLNLFWYSLIVKGALKVIRGSGKKE
mmetsp:Transcript_81314/g.136066  ORF Transcript_81314/g.136066 Transcript_81314/m.136066 type:complete len:129 (+) Transcript_81314:64-450(+)